MLKWLKNKLRNFALYFFVGMRMGDKTIFETNEGDIGGGPVGEIKNEKDSVYKDLLKGELTQEAIELRHEMYFAERASHKFKYLGGGVAMKKNSFFTFNGKIEESDGLPVQLIQPNEYDTGALYENLIERNLGTKNDKVYTLTIGYGDIIPRFNLQTLVTKLVVKRIDEDKVLLDLYTPIYQLQFKKYHRLFLNEMEKIYMGNIKSDILEIVKIYFTSFNAFGTEDLKYYEYNNLDFENIIKFDGSYVLRFTADIVKDGEDLLNEFYSKEADEKSQNHEARNSNKGATVNYTDIIAKEILNDSVSDEALDLFKAQTNGEA